MKTSRNITKHVIDIIFLLIFSLFLVSVFVVVVVLLAAAAVVFAPQRKGLPFGSELDFLVFAIVDTTPDANRKLPFLRPGLLLLLLLNDEMMMIPQHMN